MRSFIAGLSALLLGGCSGPQSMLEPAGPGAASIATLWWVLLAICTAVFLVVMAALAIGIVRSRADAPPDEARSERRRVLAVLVAGAAVPFVILMVIFGYTMVALDRIAPSDAESEWTVVVTGKQFWWEVRYALPGGDTAITANEIHLPVGERVTLVLESDDVIHSLWVPRLHGKTDMIPGRTNRTWLLAEEPGVFRGQCAEYCGTQHAWMALQVVAEPRAEFLRWLARQREPATPPAVGASPRIRRGLEVFLDPDHRCAECHTIRGVAERSGAPGEPTGIRADGPDLTHVASRRTLAAGLLTLSRGSMGGWISNPQVLKPGNRMPRIPLEPEEMNALLDYLMSLE